MVRFSALGAENLLVCTHERAKKAKQHQHNPHPSCLELLGKGGKGLQLRVHRGTVHGVGGQDAKAAAVDVQREIGGLGVLQSKFGKQTN